MVLTAGIMGFMVVALGVAWGCTVQAGILSVSPDDPDPGDVITVTGNQYHENATIQLHWGGEAGPVIGDTVADSSGTFSAEGTVPTSAEPGEHLLVAKDPDVSTSGHGEASVMVCVGGGCEEPTEEPAEQASPGDSPGEGAAHQAEPPAAEGEPQETAGEPQPAEGEPQPAEGEPQQVGGEPQQVGGEPQQVEGEPQQVGGEPQPAEGEPQQVGASEPSADDGAAQPAPTASADPAPAEPAPAQPAPAEPAPADPAEESTDSETPVESSGSATLGPDQVDRGNAAAPEAAPSERSATGDLWSGVTPSETPSLTPEAGYDSAAEAGQTGPGQFAVGLALFGAGLTVLLAGAGVPALRRRRAVAQARATRAD